MNSLNQNPGYVYLLHFEQPISAGRHAQHYIGHAYDLVKRIQIQRRGRRYNRRGKHTGCSRLCEVAKERGIRFRLVRVWQGDRHLERRIKNRRNGRNLCPICSVTPHAIRYADEVPTHFIDDHLLRY